MCRGETFILSYNDGLEETCLDFEACKRSKHDRPCTEAEITDLGVVRVDEPRPDRRRSAAIAPSADLESARTSQSGSREPLRRQSHAKDRGFRETVLMPSLFSMFRSRRRRDLYVDERNSDRHKTRRKHEHSAARKPTKPLPRAPSAPRDEEEAYDSDSGILLVTQAFFAYFQVRKRYISTPEIPVHAAPPVQSPPRDRPQSITVMQNVPYRTELRRPPAAPMPPRDSGSYEKARYRPPTVEGYSLRSTSSDSDASLHVRFSPQLRSSFTAASYPSPESSRSASDQGADLNAAAVMSGARHPSSVREAPPISTRPASSAPHIDNQRHVHYTPVPASYTLNVRDGAVSLQMFYDQQGTRHRDPRQQSGHNRRQSNSTGRRDAQR